MSFFPTAFLLKHHAGLSNMACFSCFYTDIGLFPWNLAASSAWPWSSLIIGIYFNSWLLDCSNEVNGLVCNDKPAKHKERRSREELLAGVGDDKVEDRKIFPRDSLPTQYGVGLMLWFHTGFLINHYLFRNIE